MTAPHLPVVAWRYEFCLDEKPVEAIVLDERIPARTATEQPLVRQSDALAAISAVREEVEALRKDAERWRFCAEGHMFPEFCGHDTGSPTGQSWYMPTSPIRKPPIFQTPGEAADEYMQFVAARAIRSGGR